MFSKEKNTTKNWFILIGSLFIAFLIFAGIANRKHIDREHQLTSKYEDLKKQVILIEESLKQDWFSPADNIIREQILNESRQDIEEVDKELTALKKEKLTRMIEARVEKERHKRALKEKGSGLLP